MSELAGCELEPHPMTIMHAHVNLAPLEGMTEWEASEKIENVDQWHYDTTPFVLVIFVTPPELYTGGKFEFFQGTIQEAQAFLREDGAFPEGRVRTAGVQSAGTGIFQQGSQVMHRATGVRPGQTRTTMVLSYAPIKAGIKEAATQLASTYNEVDPLPVLFAEWAIFRLWVAALELGEASQEKPSAARARMHVKEAMRAVSYSLSPEELAEKLQGAAHVAEEADVARAVTILKGAASDIISGLPKSTMVYYSGAKNGRKRKAEIQEEVPEETKFQKTKIEEVPEEIMGA